MPIPTRPAVTPGRRGPALPAVPLAVLASLLAAGCGDTREAVTPAAYVAAADAVCADARRAAAALTPPDSRSEETGYRRAVLEIGRDQLDALRGLDVAPALRERHERALDALAEQQALLDELLHQRIAGGDAAGASKLETEIADREIEMNAVARALGLSVCGRESPGAIWAGGREHREWREQYLTALDGALLFSDALEPPPPLEELAGRDLVSEADNLIAALARLSALDPPAAAGGSHAFMIDAIPPLAELWRSVARAVQARDRAAYDTALAGVERQAGVIARLEESLGG